MQRKTVNSYPGQQYASSKPIFCTCRYMGSVWRKVIMHLTRWATWDRSCLLLVHPRCTSNVLSLYLLYFLLCWVNIGRLASSQIVCALQTESHPMNNFVCGYRKRRYFHLLLSWTLFCSFLFPLRFCRPISLTAPFKRYVLKFIRYLCVLFPDDIQEVSPFLYLIRRIFPPSLILRQRHFSKVEICEHFNFLSSAYFTPKSCPFNASFARDSLCK